MLGKKPSHSANQFSSKEESTRTVPSWKDDIIDELMFGIDEEAYRHLDLGYWQSDNKEIIKEFLAKKDYAELVEMHKKMFKNLDPSLPVWHINKRMVENSNTLKAFVENTRYAMVDDSDDSVDVSKKWSQSKIKIDELSKKVSKARLAATQPEKPESERRALSAAEKQARYRAKQKRILPETWKEVKKQISLEKKDARREKKKLDRQRRNASKKLKMTEHSVMSDK